MTKYEDGGSRAGATTFAGVVLFVLGALGGGGVGVLLIVVGLALFLPGLVAVLLTPSRGPVEAPRRPWHDRP